MGRLRVRLRGKTVHEIDLNEAQSYIAGRKEDCDIVLQPEKGISREHFRLSFTEGKWIVDVISRYGEVVFNGASAQQFELSHGSQFTIPPYEFDFLEIVRTPEVSADSYRSENLPAVHGDNSISSFEGSEERTMIGAAPTSAFIKIVDKDNETSDLIRLDDGDSWIAGRESSCHIHIRDQRVSRRQFEIRKTGSQYMILDLGSVNGTLLNGNPISSSDPVAIKSGDAISVLENYLYFELHDSQFRNRLEMVNVSVPNPMVPMSHDPAAYELMQYQQPGMLPAQYQQPLQYPGAMPGAAQVPQGKIKFDFQKHRPKLIAGVVAFVVLIFLFSGGDKSPSKGSTAGAGLGTAIEAFNKLQPEQQALIRQRYKDAKNLYMQGKYQLAQDEVVKIQELIPDYEDIKEIERLSKEAIYIQEQQRRQEQIERAKIETEERIQKQAEECQKIINPNVTVAAVDECFSPVMQFNPEHPKILDLRAQAEALTTAREAKQAERAAYQGLVGRMKSLYDRAQAVHKQGKPLDAIAAYEKVIDASLPDPSGLKNQSRRNIASLRQQMNSKTASLQNEAEKYVQAQNLKGAIIALRKARSLDPTNPELPEKIEHYLLELRKQMMSLYQEGILEESFGNVDGGESKAGAKDKWKKILDQDVPDGEYYKKAYIKLKKYGAL